MGGSVESVIIMFWWVSVITFIEQQKLEVHKNSLRLISDWRDAILKFIANCNKYVTLLSCSMQFLLIGKVASASTAFHLFDQ